MKKAIELMLASVEATDRLGGVIADALNETASRGSAVLALSGNLGAGKTTLVQAIGKALGVREIINSPTFTMMNEYHSGRLALYHFDFYRVMEMAEKLEDDLSLDLVATEFDEICEAKKSVVVIEWPEYFIVHEPGSEGRKEEAKQSYLVPIDHLHLILRMNPAPNSSDNERIVSISPSGPRSERLAREIERLFAERVTQKSV